jgi:poly(A) polymerase
MRSVLDEARPLAEVFSASGHRLYLVGGVVRDLLAGGPVDDLDLDYTTDATPDVVRGLLDGTGATVWDHGARFGTISAKLDGRMVEVTTHRAEAYEPDSRKPEVVFSDDVEADLSRRDFTINAMALEVTSAEPRLIDPFDGAGDLVARRLRTPLAPEESFSDDPLRMMRAARFVARFGLEVDPAVADAVKSMAPRLGIVSMERIRAELDKLLVLPDPSQGLWFLVDLGLAEVVLPELPAMRVEQDPIHRHKDVLSHTIAVVRKTSPDLVLRLAALFHDVGKPKTRSIGDGGVSFHHHEVVGARMCRDRMKALRYSKQMIDDVSQLVYLHLRFHTYQMGWSDSAVRRFVRDAGDQLGRLIELTRCDCTTRNRRKAEMLSRRMDELEARIAELEEQEAMAAIRPDLDGAEVMAHLGVPPGPVVGQALAHLLELRLEHGPMEREAALAALDEWWAARAEG